MITPIMPVPMIMPIHKETKVNCIIQNNKQYCEQKDLSKKDGGIVSLGIVGLILWISFWCWIALRFENNTIFNPVVIMIFGGIVLPLLIINIALLV